MMKSEISTRRGRSASTIALAAVVFGALVVYPLSLGPVVWATSAMTNRSVETFGILNAIYFPLEWICAQLPDQVLEIYSSWNIWWLSLPGGTIYPA